MSTALLHRKSISCKCPRKSNSNHNFISGIMKITKSFFFKAMKNSQQKFYFTSFHWQTLLSAAIQNSGYWSSSLFLCLPQCWGDIYNCCNLEISIQHKGAACYQSSRRRQRQIKSNEKTWYRYRGDCDYQRANGFVMVSTDLEEYPVLVMVLLKNLFRPLKYYAVLYHTFPAYSFLC